MSKPSDDRTDTKNRAKKRAQKRGVWAERLTRLYLRVTGRRILATNYKTPVGEIDIVARQGGLLCFVEVKARADTDAAAAAIGSKQQRRIQRAAEAFLLQHPALQDCDVRFDVSLVGRPLGLKYLADAWRP